MSDTLLTGHILNVGDVLTSSNGRFRAQLQGDGNFVVYRLPQAVALWSTKTDGKPVKYAVMQTDGNFVLYSASTHLWATMTVGHQNAKMVMQDDGNLVIYANSGAIWSEPGVYHPRLQLLTTERQTVISNLKVIAGWSGTFIQSPDTKSKEAVWTVPDGYAVAKVNTIVHSSNNGSRAVSVIGAGLSLVTDHEVNATYDSAIAVAVKYNKMDIKAALEEKRKQHLKEYSRFKSNQNTVHAKVTASGHGVVNHDQKRGWEEISVEVELLFLGDSRDDIAASIEEEFGIDVP